MDFLIGLFFVQIIVGLLVWIVLCWAVGKWAKKKGFSQLGYELVSLFLSPLVGAVLVAVRSPNYEAQGLRQCPQCAEWIKSEARKCRFCSFEFTAEQAAHRMLT